VSLWRRLREVAAGLDLADFDTSHADTREQAARERDRTARMAAWIRCREGSDEDCRGFVTWENLAGVGADGRRRRAAG
jgi:hypothetical protein